jgi:hypothetical protein
MIPRLCDTPIANDPHERLRHPNPRTKPTATIRTPSSRNIPTRRSDAWTAPRRVGFPNHFEVIEESLMVRVTTNRTVHSGRFGDRPKRKRSDTCDHGTAVDRGTSTDLTDAGAVAR